MCHVTRILHVAHRDRFPNKQVSQTKAEGRHRMLHCTSSYSHNTQTPQKMLGKSRYTDSNRELEFQRLVCLTVYTIATCVCWGGRVRL